MITDVVIENYQAIEKAAFRLRGMTVITGPTGSGKSAVVRAMRMVTGNQRGTAFIRHGQKTCKAAIGVYGEGTVAGIERGKVNRYLLSRWNPEEGRPDVTPFTKLGSGGVPDEVTAFLRLSDVNFAGQFDSPFLLTASGAEAARKLGELTRVSLLLDAAREAARRRLRVTGDLSREAQRLDRLTAELQQYAGLQAQRDAVTRAEEAVRRVQELDRGYGELLGLYLTLVRRQEEADAMSAVLAKAPAPSLDHLERVAFRHAELAWLEEALRKAEVQAADYQVVAEAAARDEQEARTAYREALLEAGKCPTCGQGVDGFKLLAVELYGNRD